jgi:hypothetical protein
LHLLLPNGQEFSTPGRELRWASTRLAATPPEVDARLVEEAEETAVGIFRLWSPSREGEISPTEYGDLLTERGRQLLAQYDRLTDDPELDCRQGMPSTMFDPALMEIGDEGERIVIHVYEYDVERIIHVNSPDSPRGLEPSPLGYSTGHWDGQVLVVTTTAVDWPLLNYTGTPQSDQVRFAERFETSAMGELLHYSLTVEDPLMFTEPFTVRRDRTWWPQARMEPFDCVSRWADQSSDELR